MMIDMHFETGEVEDGRGVFAIFWRMTEDDTVEVFCHRDGGEISLGVEMSESLEPPSDFFWTEPEGAAGAPCIRGKFSDGIVGVSKEVKSVDLYQCTFDMPEWGRCNFEDGEIHFAVESYPRVINSSSEVCRRSKIVIERLTDFLDVPAT